MTVKVVTDSTADIPAELAREMGITVVPLYVHFGRETHQDGVDISADEFYRRLVAEPQLPKTSAPSSGMFIEVYEKLAAETDEIISIHISTKLSATYNSAVVGRDGMEASCRVEVIDSLSASIGLGVLVISAAKAALAGANLDEITATVIRTVPKICCMGVVDTLEYLHKGGRIGKAQALLGSVLGVKPLIIVRDGVVCPLGRERNRAKAVSRMCEVAGKFNHIEEMAVAHATTPDDVESLAERLTPLFPSGQIYRSMIGSTIGTYLGPGSLIVALIGEES